MKNKKLDSSELTEIFIKNMSEKISVQIEELNTKLIPLNVKIDNNVNLNEVKKTLEIAVNTVVSNELLEVVDIIKEFKDKMVENVYNEIINKLQNKIEENPIF